MITSPNINQQSETCWHISSVGNSACISIDQEKPLLCCKGGSLEFELALDSVRSEDVEGFILATDGNSLLKMLLGNPTEMDLESTFAHLRNAVTTEQQEELEPMSATAAEYCEEIIKYWESRDFIGPEDFLMDGWDDIDMAIDQASLNLAASPAPQVLEEIEDFFGVPTILYGYSEEAIAFVDQVWVPLQEYIARCAAERNPISHWGQVVNFG